MHTVLNILAGFCVLSGLVFFLGAVIGLIRFPDFYTRMHAAGKGDTLSTLLIMAGMALFYLNGMFTHGEGEEHHVTLGQFFVVLKIMAIGAFIMLTSPTSTHALMKAGYEDGIEPYSKKKGEGG